MLRQFLVAVLFCVFLGWLIAGCSNHAGGDITNSSVINPSLELDPKLLPN